MSLILSGTDGLSDVDGTAATPAIRGTDANTGIFFPAADTIAFSEGGAEAARIDSSGNVGIGTSSPTQKLDVAGQVTISSGNGYLWGNGAVQIYSNSSYLRFRTASTDRLEIDSSGNLGLGVTPSAWDTVVPAFQIGGAGGYIAAQGSAEVLRIGSNNFYNTSAFRYVINGSASRYDQSGGAHSWHTAASGTAGNAITFTQAMTLDASGNLGIGTTSPSTSNTAGASFVPGTSTVASMTGSNGSGQLLLGNNGNGSNLAVNDSCGMIAFKGRFNSTFGGGNDIASIIGTYTGNGTTRSGAIRFLTLDSGTEAERARIDSSGNLLVGTTTTNPGSTNTSTGCALNGSLGIGYFSRANDSSLLINTNANGKVSRIYRSGSEVGDITVTTTTTSFNSTSDYRLKTVLGAVADSGSRIDALEPIEYTWNSTGLRTRGFLAHKFQEVYANSVTGTKDAVNDEGKPEYQSMQAGSSEVIADLVAEIQSLRKRLAAAGI